ncbi:MAG: glycosyltransferase family 9 protein, partial [Phycisphaerae bacterium]
MTVKTMRRLDRWLGTPLCLLLTLHRRLGDAWRRLRGIGPPAFPGPGDARPAPSILLVKLAEMGSTVLALPAIRRLREMAPGVRLHYLCFEENKAVLDLLPGVRWEGVHTIRTRSIASVVGDVLRVVRRLRRVRFDAAFDMEFFSRGSAALVYLSGARVRVGYHRFHAEGLNCGDLFTHRLTYNHHLHTSGAFLALAEALAVPPGEVPLVKKRVDPPAALPAFEPAPH